MIICDIFILKDKSDLSLTKDFIEILSYSTKLLYQFVFNVIFDIIMKRILLYITKNLKLKIR